MALCSLFVSVVVLTVASTREPAQEKTRGPSKYFGQHKSIPREIFTTSWAVEITEGGQKMADMISRQYGFNNLGELDGLENIYHFQLNVKERLRAPKFSPYTTKSKQLSSERCVGFVEQQVIKQLVAYSYTVPEDPLFPSQWQLVNSGQLGENYTGRDLRVEQAWMQGLTGCNVTVTIVDDGLDARHKDIWDNFVTEISYNFVGDGYDPGAYSYHGTPVGGIVGAIKDNDVCGVGVAHNVNLGGVALLGASTDMNEARSLSYRRDIVDIYSNSWGRRRDGGPETLTQKTLESGVEKGRGGKGSIFVFSNGNGGPRDDCAASGHQSSMYTISIGSIGIDGRPSSYDEECSAKMAVAYVTNTEGDPTVSTTYLRGRCRTDFGGTSAAAPLATGIIALALEAKYVKDKKIVQS